MPAASLPVVHVDSIQPSAGRDPEESFVAEVEGRRWVFERDAGRGRSWRFADLTAEVLTARLMHRFGVAAPHARLVEVASRPGVFLQREWVGAGYAGERAPTPVRTWVGAHGRRRADRDEVRLAQLIDLLVGNGGRYGGNLFLASPGAAAPGAEADDLVVPVDRDLRGVAARAARRALQEGPRVEFYGPAFRIMRENGLYDRAYRELERSRGAMDAYHRLAVGVVERLGEPYLAGLLGSLPSLVREPEGGAAERAERLALLAWRREALAAAFRGFGWRDAAGWREGLAWFSGLHPQARALGASLGPRARTALGFRLLRARDDGDGAELYLHLRAAGVTPRPARTLLAALPGRSWRRTGGRALEVAELEHGAVEAIELAAYGEAFPSVLGRSPRPDPDPARPLDFLEVAPGERGPRLVDGRGYAVGGPRRVSLEGVARAALEALPVEAGQVLHLYRDAFVPAAVTDVFEVVRVDPDGGWRGHTRVRERAR